MPNSLNLTIAIITYKRPKLLALCLESIIKQNNPKILVIIIDNDPAKSAKNIYKQYKTCLNLSYFLNPVNSISLGRNLALDVCQSQYLAFIDDDCTLDSQWSKVAKLEIKLNPKAVFFQGIANSCKSQNPVILAQQNLYQQWINLNLSVPLKKLKAVDTKNIILNLKAIKSHSITFDKNLPQFEDVDFGLKIFQNKLQGKYLLNLAVNHQDRSRFFEVLKKFYSRGQDKFLLNQKWQNYDHFSPQTNLKILFKSSDFLTNFCQLSLDFVFNLGFINASKRQIFPKNTIHIVNSFDLAANEERAKVLASFLKDNGFSVNLIDSQLIFTNSTNYIKNLFVSPFLFLPYRLERFLAFHLKFSSLRPHLFYLELQLRGRLLQNYLKKIKAKTVISQDPKDLTCSLKPRPYRLIFDIPTVFSEELKLTNLYSKNLIKKINRLEEIAYKNSDRTYFHWSSFLKIAQQKYPHINKFFDLNWGCTTPKKLAEFNSHPKTVYLGNLNSNWINPKLLKNISKTVSLDIYSYEKPNKKIYSQLKTKGFMKNLESLSSYQFGLLTFTNDSLRNHGFSAKHLTYLSHGLPVLCPEWRQDKLLKPAAIYYNEHNLKQVLQKYSQKSLWQKKHTAALKLAQKLQWQETLKPLLAYLKLNEK